MIRFAPRCAIPVAELHHGSWRRPTRSLMEVLMQRCLRVPFFCAALFWLAGCGSTIFESTRVDYKSTANVPALEIPPDLTMPAFDERYRDRPGSATASGLAAGPQPTRVGLLPSVGVGRVERAGTQRWLVVQ